MKKEKKGKNIGIFLLKCNFILPSTIYILIIYKIKRNRQKWRKKISSENENCIARNLIQHYLNLIK